MAALLRKFYPAATSSAPTAADRAGETPWHVRRPSIVTFRNPNSDGIGLEEDSYRYEVSENVKQTPRVVRTQKKCSCSFGCNKGNWFTEKEVCIVCGAKYCCNCVLKATGRMPQGRKCVGCIGYGIDESRRKKLGKCSRLLKRLLSELEVELVMKSEIFCKVNQLPAKLDLVNGEALGQEELVRLQSCPTPPRKLKAGSYCYDYVPGFRGKPSQIISPQLDVGGHLRRNASNGNTDVLIDGREITKKELWMLQFAGVPCAGNFHYWVNAEGSFQEEGMSNVIVKIWDKTGIKLFCALLTLPTPSDPPNPSAKVPNHFEEQSFNELLVGCDKSGTYEYHI